MAAPRKYDSETRDRAVRMYRERVRDHVESKLQARHQVGALLDINPATLRGWIERQEIDSGEHPGVTSTEAAEVKALRKECERPRHPPQGRSREFPVGGRERSPLADVSSARS